MQGIKREQAANPLMIGNSDVEMFLQAETKFTIPAITKKQILRANVDYSTEKKLKKIRTLQIPYDLRNFVIENSKLYKSGNAKDINYGIFEKINTLFVVHHNALHLYNFLSSYKNVLPFSEKIVLVRELRPSNQVFKREVASIILVATESKLFFFCTKEGEDGFFEVKIEHAFAETVNNIKVNMGSRIFAITQHDVLEIIYDMYGCTSHNPDTSLFEYFMPIFYLRKKTSPIIDFDVKEKFLVVLKKNEIDIYTLDKFRKVNTLVTCRCYKNICIIEESTTNVVVNNRIIRNNLLICVVGDNGERDYYDTARLMFSRDSPLKVTKNHRFYLQGTNFILSNNEKNIIVTLNEDQIYNFDKKRATENYEIIDGGWVYCANRIFLVNETISVFEFLSGHNYLLNTKNARKVIKDYGNVSNLFYLLNKADNKDTSAFDYMFVNVEKEYVYLAVVHIIHHFYLLPVSKIYLLDLDIALRKIKNICEYDVYVKKVIGCLNFVKIAVDYQNTYIMNITIRDLLLNKDLEKRKKSIQSLNVLLLKEKCGDFLSLNDMFYGNAINLIKRGSREALMRAVDNLLNCNIDVNTVHLVINAKYYVGAAKLSRKVVATYEERVILLSQTILCYNSLLEALEDVREDFVYSVFDAFLKNKSKFQSCLCCDEKHHDISIISIDNIYLDSFLREKFLESDNKEEFDLYWKFLIYKKRYLEGVKCIDKLITMKKLTLENKIDYLVIASAFDQSFKIKLRVAKLQHKIADRLKTKMYDLFDEKTLFNEYAYPNELYDIALQLLDRCDCDQDVVVDVMYKYLKGPFNQVEAKLSSLNLKGTCHNLGTIFTVLLSKGFDETLNVCDILENLSFNKIEIIGTIEKELRYNLSPDVKAYLARCVKKKYGHVISL